MSDFPKKSFKSCLRYKDNYNSKFYKHKKYDPLEVFNEDNLNF